MTQEERTLEAYYDRLNVYAVEKSRVIVVDFSSANAGACRARRQPRGRDLSRNAADREAGPDARRRHLAGRRNREDAHARSPTPKPRSSNTASRTNLFVGSNNTSLPNQQLTEINSQIAAARGQKADLEARARQLRDLIRSGKPIDSSDIANSDTMRRLIEQRIALRAQLAEQSTTLLAQHPRIKELNAQIAEVDSQIRVEGERLARQLDNDAKVAGDRLQTLTASLDQVKKLASQTNEQDVRAARARTRGQDPARSAGILSREIPRSLRARQHQCRAAGGAHHFARLARHQAVLSEETADRADRGLRRFHVVGGLYGDRRAAGGAGASAYGYAYAPAAMPPPVTRRR